MPVYTLAQPDPNLSNHLSSFLQLFGINFTVFIQLSTLIFIFVEAIKRAFPNFLSGGWKTHTIVAVLAFLLSCKVLYPNWESVATCTVLLWLFPAGSYAVFKGPLKGTLSFLLNDIIMPLFKSSKPTIKEDNPNSTKRSLGTDLKKVREKHK
jgi:hypothetical protein